MEYFQDVLRKLGEYRGILTEDELLRIEIFGDGSGSIGSNHMKIEGFVRGELAGGISSLIKTHSRGGLASVTIRENGNSQYRDLGDVVIHEEASLRELKNWFRHQIKIR